MFHKAHLTEIKNKAKLTYIAFARYRDEYWLDYSVGGEKMLPFYLDVPPEKLTAASYKDLLNQILSQQNGQA